MGAPIKQGLWLSMGIACAYTQCVQLTALPSMWMGARSGPV